MALVAALVGVPAGDSRPAQPRLVLDECRPQRALERALPRSGKSSESALHQCHRRRASDAGHRHASHSPLVGGARTTSGDVGHALHGPATDAIRSFQASWASAWHMAPIGRAWQQRSLAQICQRSRLRLPTWRQDARQCARHDERHDRRQGMHPGGRSEPAPGRRRSSGAHRRLIESVTPARGTRRRQFSGARNACLTERKRQSREVDVDPGTPLDRVSGGLGLTAEVR